MPLAAKRHTVNLKNTTRKTKRQALAPAFFMNWMSVFKLYFFCALDYLYNYLITNTGQSAWQITFLLTLPKRNPFISPIPRLPMTIKS